MLEVFLTFDTEVWCDGWADLDARFPEAFRRYVYGPTRHGDYALPFLLRTLNDHGLTGIFFVEPLFAARFGLDPLSELVGLIQEAGQEVQLHLHTEWVDEAVQPLVESVGHKRPQIRDFSFADQVTLLSAGRDLLRAAGAPEVEAFRAGNYAANNDTLRALGLLNIPFDSSYNPGSACGIADMAPGRLLTQAEEFFGVTVYPVSCFRDRGPASLRHLQLTACSSRELTAVLDAAAAAGWQSIVLVAHNFELLNPGKTRRDPIAARRFVNLCDYLAANPDRFRVRGFRGLAAPRDGNRQQPAPIATPPLLTLGRVVEQALRRCLAA